MVEILEALSVILASWAVIAGIDAWKREFIGKRRIELAETALEKFFEVNDAIATIRNPFLYSGEGESRERSEQEDPRHSELLDRAYVVFERYEKNKSTFQSFFALKYRFMASFGREAGSIMDRTGRELNRVFVSARALGDHYWPRQGRMEMSDTERESHLEEMQKHQEIFWDGMQENDRIREELERIEKDLEDIVTPCFQETSTLYRVLTKRVSESRAVRWLRQKLNRTSNENSAPPH